MMMMRDMKERQRQQKVVPQCAHLGDVQVSPTSPAIAWRFRPNIQTVIVRPCIYIGGIVPDGVVAQAWKNSEFGGEQPVHAGPNVFDGASLVLAPQDEISVRFCGRDAVLKDVWIQFGIKV